jgi:hypothetical protein
LKCLEKRSEIKSTFGLHYNQPNHQGEKNYVEDDFSQLGFFPAWGYQRQLLLDGLYG